HGPHDDVVHVADRRPVEGDTAVLARDDRAEPPGAPALEPRWSAAARAGDAGRLVDHEAAAVAEVEGAGVVVGHALRPLTPSAAGRGSAGIRSGRSGGRRPGRRFGAWR